jgi:uncharacterized protein
MFAVTSFSMRWFAMAISVMLTTSCAMHITERSFIRPVAAAGLGQDDVKKLPEGYALSSDFLPTPDGERIYRTRFTHPEARSTILFFGGNISTVANQGIPAMKAFIASRKVNFVVVDYRGYGQSSGTPTMVSLKSDALVVFDDEAKRAAQSAHKLIVAGFSMGGMVAGSVLEQRSPAGAMLIATATTVDEFKEEAIPWYMKAFLRIDIAPELQLIDNIKAVRAYNGPLLVAGAGNDRQVPPVLSDRLYQAAKTPADHKHLAIVSGAGHNDLLEARGFREAVARFLNENAF